MPFKERKKLNNGNTLLDKKKMLVGLMPFRKVDKHSSTDEPALLPEYLLVVHRILQILGIWVVFNCIYVGPKLAWSNKRWYCVHYKYQA